MVFPDTEYAAEVFKEISVQIIRDSIYWGRKDLEDRLNEIGEEKKVDLEESKRVLIERNDMMCSNGRNWIKMRGQFDWYFKKRIENGGDMPRDELKDGFGIYHRRGNDNPINYFLEAVDAYNDALSTESRNLEIREKRGVLESTIKYMGAEFKPGYEPVFDKEDISSYSKIPGNPAADFDKLDGEYKDVVIFCFSTMDRKRGFSEKVMSNKEYRRLSEFFRGILDRA